MNDNHKINQHTTNDIIREATIADRHDIEQLKSKLQMYFAQIDSMNETAMYDNANYTRLYVDKMFGQIKKPNRKIFVAEKNQHIIGFVQGVIIERQNKNEQNLCVRNTPKEGWVGLLFVKSAFRKQGVGQQLLDTIKESFRKAGCVSIRLLVLSDNAPARAFYKKNGYKNHALELILKLNQ